MRTGDRTVHAEEIIVGSGQNVSGPSPNNFSSTANRDRLRKFIDDSAAILFGVLFTIVIVSMIFRGRNSAQSILAMMAERDGIILRLLFILLILVLLVLGLQSAIRLLRSTFASPADNTPLYSSDKNSPMPLWKRRSVKIFWLVSAPVVISTLASTRGISPHPIFLFCAIIFPLLGGFIILFTRKRRIGLYYICIGLSVFIGAAYIGLASSSHRCGQTSGSFDPGLIVPCPRGVDTKVGDPSQVW